MADGIPLLLLKAEDKNCWSMILHHANGRTTTFPCATPAEHLIAASEIDYRPYRREIQKLREQHPFFEARFEAVIFVNGCFCSGPAKSTTPGPSKTTNFSPLKITNPS